MSESKPIFNKENILYEREEKNGFWSFIPKFHPETGEIIINPTSRDILNFANGKNTIQEITKHIVKKYNIENDKKIKQEIYKTIGSFSRLGVIEWTDENPFLYLREEPVNNEISMIVGQEHHIDKIQEFISMNYLSSKKSCINYFLPLFNIKDYDELKLRRKLFTYSEEFFLLLKRNRIIGCISLDISSNNYLETSAVIKIIMVPEKYISQLLQYAQDILPYIVVKDITKIKILEQKNSPIGKFLMNLLKKEKYQKEGLLKNEFGFGLNINLWARYYNPKLIEKIKSIHNKKLNGNGR